MPVEAIPLDQTPPPGSKSIADLRDNILVNLGSGGGLPGGVEVELNDAELDQCIQSALYKLNAHRPQRANANASVPKGVTAIPMLFPSFIGVVDVQSAPASGACASEAFPDPFAQDGFAGAAYGGGFAANPYGDTYADVLSQQQYSKTVNQIRSQEVQWTTRVDQSGRTTLYITSPGPARVEYIYTWAITQNDDPLTGVARMGIADYDFTQNYSEAVAKQILGRKLRKYGGGINTPDGGTETLDGDQLYQEGTTETAELEASLKARRRPIAPARG